MHPCIHLTFNARLAKEYQIWDRPQGLMGIWGKIIREWLDEILPENATEM
jgi:hypothetical protein